MATGDQTGQQATAGAAAVITPSAGGAATGGTTDPANVVVDKNKTPEQYIVEAESYYIVPRLVRTKYPDLVKLIYETESMDSEEREYWLQIMPIMTEEQIKKFRNILVNEKEQLTKLDKEYQQEMARIKGKPVKEIDEAELKGKIEEIKAAETKSKADEKKEEEELLKKLEGL